MPDKTLAGRTMGNAEIARRLAETAQLLRAAGDNPFKAKAYYRAAETVAGLGESVAQLVRQGDDLTRFPGIGKGIAAALREIVLSGKLGQREMLLATVPADVAALAEHPRLDPQRVGRIFKKLGIATVDELKQKFNDGTVGKRFGRAMDDHLRQAFRTNQEMLLFDADELADRIERYLQKENAPARLLRVGEQRRRVEVVSEIVFLVGTDDFPGSVAALANYGGGLERLALSARKASFRLPGSVQVTLKRAAPKTWGLAAIAATGSADHLQELEERTGPLSRVRFRKGEGAEKEEGVYAAWGLAWIPPELREGRGEVELAADNRLPHLVSVEDIRGELHAHSTSSDGVHSIAEMAAAAQERHYDYIGITDHSQSLKIAGGVSVADLWAQIRAIDRLNEQLTGIRVLKSAEVDILVDGTLDYPADLLAELDYTVCSIHSRFRLGKAEQTERILRAMDNPAFTILGHATGRLLLQRPGYEFDWDRIIPHAKDAGCFFEINSDPDRLDLSSDHARLVASAGIKVAICTDAHRASGLGFIGCGVDVARRAGLTKVDILNAQSWPDLHRAIRRSKRGA